MPDNDAAAPGAFRAAYAPTSSRNSTGRRFLPHNPSTTTASNTSTASASASSCAKEGASSLHRSSHWQGRRGRKHGKPRKRRQSGRGCARPRWHPRSAGTYRLRESRYKRIPPAGTFAPTPPSARACVRNKPISFGGTRQGLSYVQNSAPSTCQNQAPLIFSLFAHTETMRSFRFLHPPRNVQQPSLRRLGRWLWPEPASQDFRLPVSRQDLPQPNRGYPPIRSRRTKASR
ncbi:hypothetical protein CM49_01341 [Paenibacillus sp. P1XP2]|nr:hypothetical protein CM49_01341 [Paenibacillus sp. P1XP2]